MGDCFRSINPQLIMLGQEPRQTTSNLGHLHKPSIQALIHGLNRHYYSIALSYKQNELEQQMLMNLHKKNWTDGLKRTRCSSRRWARWTPRSGSRTPCSTPSSSEAARRAAMGTGSSESSGSAGRLAGP